MTLLLLFRSTVEEAPTEVITVPVYGGVRRRQHPSRKLSQQYMCRMLRAYCRIKDDEEMTVKGKIYDIKEMGCRGYVDYKTPLVKKLLEYYDMLEAI